ncbi:MAG TPA: serine acetyltransferase [Salinivirgaceae bacterium]|nr:serine acetyltransferase [Salinivirgaceae bacterium]
MIDIAIVGAGGFGHELACLINHINKVKPTYRFIGYFDYSIPKGTVLRYGKVLGDSDEYNSWPTPLGLVIGVALTQKLKSIPGKITNPNIFFPNLIAPNVLFFDESSFSMGVGNIITFNCRFSCNVRLGNFNILNGGITFGHDVVVGNYNVFQPETRLSGEVTVGDQNYFGTRATVLQQINIGNQTRIGAGSVVMRNTVDGKTYHGNPAKIIETK